MSDLADKLKLEKRMIPRVKRIFRRMATDLEASVLLTGSPQNAQRYATAFNGIIQEQYEDAKSLFGLQLFDQLEDEPADGAIWTALLLVGAAVGLTTKSEILSWMEANSNFRINIFIDREVPESTSEITATNTRDLSAAVVVANTNLINDLGRAPTRIELAAGSKKQFLRHDLGRSTTIAMTTTQQAAEGMKNINVNVLTEFRTESSSVARDLPPPTIDETWEAILDSKTRAAHSIADGQVRNNGIFIVSGENLRFPGDTALGATLPNIINCRCASVINYIENNIFEG